MNNVIEFATIRHGRDRDAMNSASVQSSEREPSTHISVRAVERSKIHQAVRQTKKLGTADGEVVARRLTDFLEHAKEKGIRRTAVLKKALPNQHLKYLAKLTLPPKGEPVPDRRWGELQKGPKNYASVATAAAELLQEDVEDVLLQLFRGTAVDDTNQTLCQRLGEMPEIDDCWLHLSKRISDMVRWVSKKTGMQEHVRRTAGVTGQYDLGEGAIRPSTGALFPHGPLANEFEVVDEFPPVPSVLIHEDEIGVFPSRHLELTHGDTSISLKVDVHAIRELRLAIGPVDSFEDVGALFEVRTRIDLTGAAEPIELLRPWLYLEGHGSFDVRWRGAVWHAELEIDPDHDPLAGAPLAPLEGQGQGWDGGTLQPAHNYAVWYPVTPRTCERLLSRPTNAFQHSARCPYDRTSVPTLCPAQTVGAAIESAVLTGAERLQESLLSEAVSISDLVKAYVGERRQEAYALHQEASRRWSAE